MDIAEFVYNRSPYYLQNIYIWIGKWNENRKTHKYLADRRQELIDTEGFSLSELEEMQLERLKRLVKEAYDNVPYYREIFRKIKARPTDIKKLEDITIIPTLDKEEIRNCYKAFINPNIRKKEMWQVHTSGTTGSPMSFLSDLLSQSDYEAHVERHRRWFGYNSDEICGSFGGKKIIPEQTGRGPAWRYDRPDNLIVFSTFHLDDEHMQDYFDFINGKGIKYIKGYPSNLYIFGRYLMNTRQRLQVRCVFTGAEPVYPHIRDVIENAFECEIADFYGLSEGVAIAYECPSHRGYHIGMESTLIELLDKEEAPSDSGEIVGTSLTNYAMPLIRYRTGDYTSVDRGKCNCGREHKMIRQVQTKVEDIVVTKEGRFLSPSNLTHPFKPINPMAIERSQIIQSKLGAITIRIQRGPAYSKDVKAELLNNFHKRFGEELEVFIEIVDSIQIGGREKFRWVRSEIMNDIWGKAPG